MKVAISTLSSPNYPDSALQGLGEDMISTPGSLQKNSLEASYRYCQRYFQLTHSVLTQAAFSLCQINIDYQT